MRIISMLTFVVFMVLSPAAPVSKRHDIDDRRYQELAQLYPEVGRFTFGKPTDAGSAILIGEQWILMASHNLMFGTGPLQVEFNGQQYPIDWYRRHFAKLPQPNSADFNFDIAICHLAEPVRNVTPAKIYTQNDEIGQKVTIVGYGRPGNGLEGAPLSGQTDIKRAGTNRIDAIGNFNGEIELDRQGLLLFCDFDAPQIGQCKNWFDGDAVPTELECMMTTGDSGGGVFIDTADGRQLIGINSGCIGENGKVTGASGDKHRYGILARLVRISQFHEWVTAMQQLYEQDAVLTTGLIAHWDFEAVEDPFVYDVSGTGHRGEIVGARLTDGLRGKACRFDPVVGRPADSDSNEAKPEELNSRFLRVNNETELFYKVGNAVLNDLKLTNDFTLMTWARFDQGPTVDHPPPSAPGRSLIGEINLLEKRRLTATDQPRPADFVWAIREHNLILQWGNEPVELGAPLPTDLNWQQWNLLVVVRRGTIVEFYVNGECIGKGQTEGQLPTSDQPLLIGRRVTDDDAHALCVDDVRIYNRALTAADIQSYWQSQTAPK